MRIASVVGARPQFIKYAPLSRELSKSHSEVLIHTGQHYDYNMDKVFFDEMGIRPPDYNLGVASGTHAYQTGEMMKGIENILTEEEPDLVMVYGDTNSTLAGALSAAKLRIMVAHVEAGLRSSDKSMPEEVNRILTDHCSAWLFCPTLTAVDNLRREGITEGVYLTGDVMVDSLALSREPAEQSDILDSLRLTDGRYILTTLHRASNTDIRHNLEVITGALIDLSRQGEVIVFPTHPRTKKSLKEYGLYDKLGLAVKLIEPVGYFEFLKLLGHSKKVLTDAGGVQKEAYILRIPCVTLRDTTEWIETVQDGWNVLVGPDKEKIVHMAKTFEPSMQTHRERFGKGDACAHILDILSKCPDMSPARPDLPRR